MPILGTLGKKSKNEIRLSTTPFTGSVSNPEGNEANPVNDFVYFRRALVLGYFKNFYYTDTELLNIFVDHVNATFTEDNGEIAHSILDMAFEIYENSFYLDLETLMLFFELVTETSPMYAQRVYEYIPRFRNSSHFLLFAKIVNMRRGWGSGLRKAVNAFYTHVPEDKLLFDILKYQQRWGISHKDVLFKAHPTLNATVFNTIMGNPVDNDFVNTVRFLLSGKATEKDVEHAFTHYRLSHEMINTSTLTPEVWKILAKHKAIPLHAVLWNLGRFTRAGLFRNKEFRNEILRVIESGTKHMNPFDYFKAHAAYINGSGTRMSWEPVEQIEEALLNAFLHSVANETFEYTGNVVFALDMSASMTWAESAFPHTNGSTAAAVALFTLLKTTPNAQVVEFTGEAAPSALNRVMNLAQVIGYARLANGGRTDHSSVIRYLIQHNVNADVLVYLTDNVQTDGNNMSDMLKWYESKLGHSLKVINIAMTPMEYSAVFKEDGDVLELSGFDNMKLWEMALTL